MGPIRNKLIFGLAVLLVMLGALASSGLWGVYAYRGLVRNLRGRAEELSLANQMARVIGDLRVSLAELPGTNWNDDQTLELPQTSWTGNEFEQRLLRAQQILKLYQTEITYPTESDDEFASKEFEQATAQEIHAGLERIQHQTAHTWWISDTTLVRELQNDLNQLHAKTESLPSHLHYQLGTLADSVRSEYRALLAINWLASLAAVALLLGFLYLNYRWIFRPLGVLVAGSRRVAAGDFAYRIHLTTRDEMAELADALNHMTTSFQQIRDDLDRQVQERTKQVVRSEQLASVGFLAAGVAHEINNPLASIAMCAESLEGRLHDLASELTTTQLESTTKQQELDQEATQPWSETLDVATRYLNMIQTEAFRCKEITEKLLDFSRLGNPKRELTDLRQLVQQVVEMVRHLDKYQDRQIKLASVSSNADPVLAEVVATEIKQVVLNLVTNALDSLDSGGTLRIQVDANQGFAELIFNDNGCGMTTETLTQLFEPFFTRKRHGQGTGLGLSITYRIVADHGGQIIAHSAGLGQGAQFTVTLPLHAAATETNYQKSKETSHRYQAA